MFATDQQGWDTFDMAGVLSNIPDSMKYIFAEIIRSTMTSRELNQEIKDILIYACYHSTLSFDDKEVLSW